MNEDRLLRELGDLAREEERAGKARFDERWDRLAAGTLSAEEEAGLKALAETSPEAREAWEAFRPLGPEFQARMAERIAAELPQERKARILPFRPAIWSGGLVTAAAAAAAFFFMVQRPAEPLPGYRIDSITGPSEMRGERAEEPVPVFAPGDRIRVDLRPETASRGRLKAQLFLLRGDELLPLDTENKIEGGSVRMYASLDRSLQEGTWTLWAVVGRPGGLPEPAQLQALAAQGEIRQRDWVAVPRNIRIQPRGP